jgi:hypothetical protein
VNSRRDASSGTDPALPRSCRTKTVLLQENHMLKGLILWLLGVPLFVIILLFIFVF